MEQFSLTANFYVHDSYTVYTRMYNVCMSVHVQYNKALGVSTRRVVLVHIQASVYMYMYVHVYIYICICSLLYMYMYSKIQQMIK